MPRDYKLYLEDILESIKKIREYIAGMSFDQFCVDRKTQDAVVRNLEVIGEAARNLPDEIKNIIADIEWKKITSLRNLLAHEYFGINQKSYGTLFKTRYRSYIRLANIL
jgi:hypothetical protein